MSSPASPEQPQDQSPDSPSPTTLTTEFISSSTKKHRLRKYSDHREYESLGKRKRRKSERPQRRDDATDEIVNEKDTAETLDDENASRPHKRRRISLFEDTDLSKVDQEATKEFLSSSGQILGQQKPRMHLGEEDDGDLVMARTSSSATVHIGAAAGPQGNDASPQFDNNNTAAAPEDDDLGFVADELFFSNDYGASDNAEGRRTSGVDETAPSNEDITITTTTTTTLLEDELSDSTKEFPASQHTETPPPPPEGEPDLRHWITVVKSRFNKSFLFNTILLLFLFLSVLALALWPRADHPRRLHEKESILRTSIVLKEDVENMMKNYMNAWTQEKTSRFTSFSDLSFLEEKVKTWMKKIEKSLKNTASGITHEDASVVTKEMLENRDQSLHQQLSDTLKQVNAMHSALSTLEDKMQTIPTTEPTDYSSAIEDLNESQARSAKEMQTRVNDLLTSLEDSKEYLKNQLETFSSRLELVEKSTSDRLNEDNILKDSISSGSLSNLDDRALRAIISTVKNSVIEELESDKVHMPDLALESRGARVVNASKSYNWLSLSVWRDSVLRKMLFLKKVKKWRLKEESDPAWALDPDMTPGRCWSFSGNNGYLVIQLPVYAHAKYFTIDHIAKSIATELSSAPKEFQVYGIDSQTGSESLLSHNTFDYTSTTQTFASDASEEWFDRFRVEILSNHGHEQYTCLYRFRIHGAQRSNAPKSIDEVQREE